MSTVEPTGIELHINRKLEAATVLSTTVSLDVDVVTAKISVNDVVLANSILSRANIANADGSNGKVGTGTGTGVGTGVGNSPQHSRGRSSTTSSVVPSILPIQKGECSQEAVTIYDFVGQLGCISLVAINDFNGQTLPILRILLDRCDFRAGGKVEDVTGEGSFQISAEHYNTKVAVWEPLIERWGPKISVISNVLSGTIVEVISDSTLQVDVSGAMVKTFSQVSNLTSVILEEFESHSQSLLLNGNNGNNNSNNNNDNNNNNNNNNSNNNKVRSSLRSVLSDKALSKGLDSPILFKNNLEFPIEVFDSLTHESLMILRSGDTAPLITPGSLSRSWVQNQGKYPILYDIRVLGRLKDQRLPLLHLPLNINKPRPYSLQPNLNGSNNYGEKRIDRSRGTEPIIEESYENQRFHPLEGRWSAPWVELQDPFIWTDVLGLNSKNPSSVQLPNDSWEWVESDWKVDLSGIIGVEIDEKGWEYATNFPSFTISKKKRTKKSMDVVRRRKWIRSRIPKSSLSDESLKALTVIWDVRALSDGSRIASIRSGLQVKNLMPFPLSIAIDGFPGLASSSAFHRLEEGDQDSRLPTDREVPYKAGTIGRHGGVSARIFDNIPEGETFSLPLLLSSASLMKVKPTGQYHRWSKSLSCRLNNFRMVIGEDDMNRKDNKYEYEYENDSEKSSRHPSHFRNMVAPEGILLSARDHHDLLCPLDDSKNKNSPASNVCVQGLLLTSDRSRLVACVPYSICHNHLPCVLSFKFLGGDGHSEQVTFRMISVRTYSGFAVCTYTDLDSLFWSRHESLSL